MVATGDIVVAGIVGVGLLAVGGLAAKQLTDILGNVSDAIPSLDDVIPDLSNIFGGLNLSLGGNNLFGSEDAPSDTATRKASEILRGLTGMGKVNPNNTAPNLEFTIGQINPAIPPEILEARLQQNIANPRYVGPLRVESTRASPEFRFFKQVGEVLRNDPIFGAGIASGGALLKGLIR